jgi:hypothetical protein
MCSRLTRVTRRRTRVLYICRQLRGATLIFKVQDSTTPNGLNAELHGVAFMELGRGALLPRFRYLSRGDGRFWRPFGRASADAK